MWNNNENLHLVFSSYFGDIFAPTSRHSPWNVIEEIYESDNATSSAEEIQSENFADTQIEIEKS